MKKFWQQFLVEDWVVTIISIPLLIIAGFAYYLPEISIPSDLRSWGAWADMGKLWLPNEIEVYGCGIRSNVCQTTGFWFPEAGLSIQFPWFANNCENRIKRNSSNGRCNWWLSSVASGHSTTVCLVNNSGHAHNYAATIASIYAPLCFCI